MENKLLNKRNIGRIITGYIISLTVALVGIFVIALCVENEYYDITKSKYAVTAVWFIAAFVGVYGTVERGVEGNVYLQLAVCMLLIVTVPIIGLVGFGEVKGAMVIFGIVAFLAGGTTGIILRMHGDSRKKTRKHRRPSR